MKILEIMTTSPSCCVPNDTSIRAARIMKEMDTGIVPVVESSTSRKVIGVVTDRDLCLAVVAEGKDPKAVQVQSCMTTKVVSCEPDQDVEVALKLMRENLVRRVLVVDRHGIIQGVVSMADIVRASNAAPEETHQTLKQVSEPTDTPSKPRQTERYGRTG
jgi:CBS domain-containing protein